MAACYGKVMDDELAGRLSRNVKELRQARGLTQVQMAKLSGLPRATWSNLESGAANPTLSVLHKVAHALQVTLEEIVAAPRSGVKHYPKGTLPTRTRGETLISSLLPDKIPGVVIERLELRPGGRLVGVPHTPGTREYLTCESGAIDLVASGEAWRVEQGDVVVFRGDQRHSYANPTRAPAVGYSVVLLEPVR